MTDKFNNSNAHLRTLSGSSSSSNDPTRAGSGGPFEPSYLDHMITRSTDARDACRGFFHHRVFRLATKIIE